MWILQGLYSIIRCRLIGIGIPIINLRRLSDRLRFIMGIPIPIRWCLLSEYRPWSTVSRGGLVKQVTQKSFSSFHTDECIIDEPKTLIKQQVHDMIVKLLNSIVTQSFSPTTKNRHPMTHPWRGNRDVICVTKVWFLPSVFAHGMLCFPQYQVYYSGNL